ncbi:MAG: matrixin family metalloprotease [Thaumarchaeota archaeon]|nr:matrixin family metalloprotease [Nitrososphaerota archaeon]
MLTIYLTGHLLEQNDKEFLDRGRILIEPLRANIIDTTIPWHLAADQTINVNIINSESVSSHKIDIIRDAILSPQIVNISGDSQGGSTGTVYYAGWEAALTHASEKPTKFFIPKKFSVTESLDNIGDITIILSHLKNEEGYLGFTKLKIDNDQIVKATMTIYDVDNLSDADLSTIAKHEFGHALGLGHSASGNDLMHDTIDTKYSYISKCDIEAVSELYDGKESTEIVCGT